MKWILVANLLCLLVITDAQNARSYDTNDWVPITPSSEENVDVEPKKAMGRVLNLDAPAQKFFPEEDYSRKRRPQVQQFLRETSIPKHHSTSSRQHKQKISHQPYKYENNRQVNHHQSKFINQGQPPLQYFTNKEVKLPTVEQPPPIQQSHYLAPLSLVQQPQFILPPQVNYNPQSVPSSNTPNLYEHFAVPVNTSLYQNLNPVSINRELLGAIRNQQVEPVPKEIPTVTPKFQEENETVQLLYVPLENLKPNQPISQSSQTIYQQADPPRQEKLTSNYVSGNANNRQLHIANIQQDFIQQALQAHRLQQQIQQGQPIVYQQPEVSTTTSTTPKPKKRKPHQPPLAVYMGGDTHADVNEVLGALKDAKSISVQDTVQPNSPKIFIGPSTLDIPDGYSKFPLPYLNTISGSRIERKVDQLPFFVAPLSYKAPPGYSKIPLPSPHVGSVVVSTKDDLNDDNISTQPLSTNPNHINDYQFLPQQTTKPKPDSFLDNYNYNGQTTFNSNQHNFDNIANNPYSGSFDPFSVHQQSPTLQQFNQPTVSHQSNVKQATDFSSLGQFSQPAYHDQKEPKARLQPQQYEQFPIVQKSPETPQFTQFSQSTFNDQEDVKQVPHTQFGQTYFDTQDVTTRSPPRSNERKKPASQSVAELGQTYYNSGELSSRPHTEELSQYDQAYNIQQTPEPPHLLEYNLPTQSAQDNTKHIPNPVIQYNTSPYLSSIEGKQTPTISITPKTNTQSYEEHPDDKSKFSTPSLPASNSFTQPYPEGTIKQSQQFTNPLDLAINQYELHQINSQLEPNKDVPEQKKYNSQYNENTFTSTSTSTPNLENSYNEPSTTTQKTVRTKPQRRRKPTRTTTRPTENTYVEDSKYTVLEEFSVKNSATTSKYQPETDSISAYKSTTTPAYSGDEQTPTNENVYKLSSTTSRYESTEPIVESIPVKVYKLPLSDLVPEARPTTAHKLNQALMDQQILNSNYKNNKEQQQFVNEDASSNQYNNKQVSDQQVYLEQQSDVNIEPLVHNRGQQHQQEQPQQFIQNSQHASSVADNQNTHEYQQPHLQQNKHPSLLNFEINENLFSYSQQPPSTESKQVLPVVSNLQEQAVRPLLSPNFLVPTTEQQSQATPKYEINHQPEEHIEVTTKISTTEAFRPETTTTRPRSRGRVRGSSSRYTAPTVPPTRRAVVSRRRPLPTRTTTERTRTTTEYSSRESNEHFTRKSVNNSKQRFRTRGRPLPNAITERISQVTQENEIRSFKTPSVEGGFQVSQSRPEPNSYMKFEHTVDEQKIITVKPDAEAETSAVIKDYHQVYSLPSQGVVTENIRVGVQYEDVDPVRKPMVDVQIKHPITEAYKETLNPDSQYIRSNANVQSGGVLYNNKNNDGTTTTRSSVRTRGRTRGRSRFATTTSRPTRVTTTTTENIQPQQESNDNNEFFGFIRAPDFNSQQKSSSNQVKLTTQQPVQLYSSTYQSSQTPLIILNDDTPAYSYPTERPGTQSPVHFVGKILPKYQNEENPTSVEANSNPVQPETEAPKTRTRGRIRVPSRKTQTTNQQNQKQSINDISGPGVSEQATRRSSIIRTRGRAHYKVPENLRQKVQEDREEELNYPPSFFKNKDSVTPKPSQFQITIEPNVNDEESEDDDQSPHPSIYSPRFVPKPNEEWTEISNPASINHLENTELKTSVSEPLALPIVDTTTKGSDVTEVESIENITKLLEDITQQNDEISSPTTQDPIEDITKKKGRRRGVWKLVKHKPVDHFETAESQNYQSVINNFDSIEKVNGNKFESYFSQTINTPAKDDYIYRNYEDLTEQTISDYEQTTILPTTTEDGNIFDTLYEMFGMNNAESMETSVAVTEHDSSGSTTTTISPTFPEELTETPTTEFFMELNKTSTVGVTDTVKVEPTTQFSAELDETTVITNSPKAEVTRSTFEVEPWDMRSVKTSTSTEISHETEICYKGRCVKSKDKKIKT